MKSIINKARPLNTTISENAPISIRTAIHTTRHGPYYDMHFGLELGVVLAGAMKRHYPGHSRVVRRGQIWFCGMWEPHGFEVVSTPCEVMVLVIWPPILAQQRFEESREIKWLAPFIVAPSARPQVPQARENDLLEQANQLKGLTAPLKPMDRARLRIGLLNILTMVLDVCPESKSENINLVCRPTGPASEYWSRLNRAVQLVFKINSFISTAWAAKECGLNRNIFSRLFRQWMGINFADFALRYRLKLAASQLLTGNDPIKAVAKQLGFKDQSNFIHVFRKYYGCSPSEFREKNQ